MPYYVHHRYHNYKKFWILPELNEMLTVKKEDGTRLTWLCHRYMVMSHVINFTGACMHTMHELVCAKKLPQYAIIREIVIVW